MRGSGIQGPSGPESGNTGRRRTSGERGGGRPRASPPHACVKAHDGRGEDHRHHSKYSFDQVLKRSPRLTRAASSRITAGVRRMIRVVP